MTDMRGLDQRCTTPMARFRLDSATHTVGDDLVVGGSPRRAFRLTAAGTALYARIAAGHDVAPSPLTERLLTAGAIHPVIDGMRSRFTAADVTVVVPTLNDTRRDLESVVKHCTDAGAILIVDDGSDVPISGLTGASVVRLRQNSGPATARNTGLRAATTDLIAFVDSDVQLHDGWLEPLLAHFDDDSVAFVAPRVASGLPAAGADPLVARYEQSHSPLDLGPDPAWVAPGTAVSYVPSAVLIVRADALREIGGFDTTMRVGEDVDAVWRLVTAGWRGRYEPAVVVHHRPRGSWRALARQRIAYGESAAALAKRHGTRVAAAHVHPASVAGWGLAATGHLAAAGGVFGATTLAMVAKLRGIPPTDAVRLAGTGHLAAGGALATAVRRVWFPLAALSSIRSPRARLLTLAAFAPALVRGGPARWFDDVAYAIGVWRGVWRDRRLTPLLPRFVRGGPTRVSGGDT